MKLTKWVVCAAALALWAGLPALAAESGQDQPQAEVSGQQATGSQSYYQQTRNKLDEIREGINRWWTEASKDTGKTTGEARESLNRTYQDLTSKHGAAESKLSGLKEGTNEGFEKLRQETEQAVEDLNQAYRKAVGPAPAEKNLDEEKARKEVRTSLQDLDAKVDALVTWAREKGADAKVEVKKALAELKEERARAWAQYRKLEAAGSETWESVKAETGKALDRLKAAYEKTREKVKGGN